MDLCEFQTCLVYKANSRTMRWGGGASKGEHRNEGKEKCPKRLIKKPIIYLQKMEKLKMKSTAYHERQKLTL